MSRICVYLACIAFLHIGVRSERDGLCQMPFCDCKAAAHPSWSIVNCTLPSNKKLDIFEGDLPKNTTDLILTGGEAIMFGVNSLTPLADARQINVSGAKLIVLRKFAGVNLYVVHAFLNIEDCDVLRIEQRTFSNIKGPLSVSITNCDSVSLEGDAFSWLLLMNITSVRKLELGPSTFTLDPTAANVDNHGPGMMIQLKNLTISEFAAQSFGSSAARIAMESVDIHAIRSGAFSANTYNIVMAINCSFHIIEEGAFAAHSLINNLHFFGCRIHEFGSQALQSAIGKLKILNTRFDYIKKGAINATVASVVIENSTFKKFQSKGFEFDSYNKITLKKNSFDDLPPNAIIATTSSLDEITFVENEIETIHPNSLAFIGHVQPRAGPKTWYQNNYYGMPCNCNISNLISKALATKVGIPFDTESYCTVNEFFAVCFNEPQQNILFDTFITKVCNSDVTINCEGITVRNAGPAVEIKNPRFPHKKDEDDEGLSDRNKKVIGIVIVTCFGCVIIVMIVSLIRCLRRRGYCATLKNFLISSNSSCGALCNRICVCNRSNGIDTAQSISQLSVHEYSERHRLHEPRMSELIQETALRDVITTDDKITQTLPEELTRELLENLKEKLDNPENYMEAREMIEHLYELTKMEENHNINAPTLIKVDENIYELPFQNTSPRVGKNMKKMVSVGTRVPSLEKLLPLPSYMPSTTLAQEYFEPKDMAVHLYAEISNIDKEKRTLLSNIPDVIAEQAVPRGPYLRAVRDKMALSPPSSPSSYSMGSFPSNPLSFSSTRSDKSNSSTTSAGKMANRPLPEKPISQDAGEGTSFNRA